MNKLKISGLAVLMFVGLSTVKTMGQEIEISVLGGLSKSKQPKTKLADGSTVGFSALFMQPLNESWKLGIGAEFGMYQLKKEMGNQNGTISSIDSQGDPFQFRYKMDNYTEDLKGNYFAIPLKVQYEGGPIGTSKLNFYAAAGVKFQLYSKVKSDQKIHGLTTSGYYPQWDAELHQPIEEGFGELGDQSRNEKLKLNNGFLLLGEAGVKYALTEKRTIYVGLFGDYDLGSSGSEVNTLVTYKKKPVTTSTVPSENEKYKLRMFTLGIKVKYAFGL